MVAFDVSKLHTCLADLLGRHQRGLLHLVLLYAQ
jgi:hypothetical protein